MLRKTLRSRVTVATFSLTTLVTLLYTVGAPWDVH